MFGVQLQHKRLKTAIHDGCSAEAWNAIQKIDGEQ